MRRWVLVVGLAAVLLAISLTWFGLGPAWATFQKRATPQTQIASSPSGLLRPVDVTGKTLGKITFREYERDCDWPIPVKLDGHWRYISEDGAEVSDSYSSASCVVDGKGVATRGLQLVLIEDVGKGKVLKQTAIVDDAWKVLAPAFGLLEYWGPELLRFRWVGNDLIWFRFCWRPGEGDGGPVCKSGHLTGAGRVVAGADVMGPFSEGLAYFWKKGWEGVGYVDTSLKLKISPELQYDSVSRFRENRAYVSVGTESLRGYIDTSGKLVIKPQFRSAGMFFEGVAAVQDAGTNLWGYIDRNGAFVFPPQFVEADRFRGGLARVKHESGYLHINKTGEIVFRDWPAQ